MTYAALLVAADLLVGLTLAASALMILIRRGRRRISYLLMLASATWFAGDLSARLVFLHRGPMVHLHLSYPTGRLHRWPARLAVTAAYAVAILEGWPRAPAVTALLAGAVAVAAIDTYLHTHGPARRAGLPALVAALLFASVLALSAANLLLNLQVDEPVALAYDLVMIVVAAWLAVDLLRGRWTEATVAQLVTQLGGDPRGVGLQAELRRALGDPSLLLAFRDGSRFVDQDGKPLDPNRQRDRVVTPVDEDGETIAVLVHDPGLLADPALISGATAALRVAVSNARLRADIAARAEVLAAARRGLVETAEAQRRELLADLTGGPELELARLEELLREAARRNEALEGPIDQVAAGVAAAREELRRFAQGLRPDALDKDGVLGAIAHLTARGGLAVTATVDVGALPAPVETAVYFVCAEALTNAAKHAGASQVHLEVAQRGGTAVATVQDDGVGGAEPSGSGLQGLADRVAALGGRFTVDSPRGGGTLVCASIPVNSGGQP